jgi:hypothetical protein
MWATPFSACLPNRPPNSASVFRSPSLMRMRPVIYWHKIRFSVTKYPLHSRSSWSTEVARYVGNHFPPIVSALPLVCFSDEESQCPRHGADSRQHP